jgi:hypothetical protein
MMWYLRAQLCLLMDEYADMKNGVWVEINESHVVRVVPFYDIYIFPWVFFFSSEIFFLT